MIQETSTLLKYYVDKAKALEKHGAHIIAIKDMSSLLKPMAAHKLIKALKNEVSVPIHLHTHDTSGNGGATLMMAAMAGVDIVDAAFDSMAGLTSQPPLNSTVAALRAHRKSYRHGYRRSPADLNLLVRNQTYLQRFRV